MPQPVTDQLGPPAHLPPIATDTFSPPVIPQYDAGGFQTNAVSVHRATLPDLATTLEILARHDSLPASSPELLPVTTPSHYREESALLIGALVREARLQRKLSQSQLAARIGARTTLIRDLEAGRGSAHTSPAILGLTASELGLDRLRLGELASGLSPKRAHECELRLAARSRGRDVLRDVPPELLDVINAMLIDLQDDQ